MLLGRLVDGPEDDAPDLDVHAFGNFDRGIGLVLRHQPDLAVSLVEALDRELAVDDGHDDVFVTGRFRPVDDEQVAVVQVRIDHGIPVHMGEEGRGGMLDEVLMQVERFLEVIVGGRGEAGRDALREVRNPVERGSGRGDKAEGLSCAGAGGAGGVRHGDHPVV